MHGAGLPEQGLRLAAQLVGFAEHHGAEEAGEDGTFFGDAEVEDFFEMGGGAGAALKIRRGGAFDGEDLAAFQTEVQAGTGEIAVERVGGRIARERCEHAEGGDDGAAHGRGFPFLSVREK